MQNPIDKPFWLTTDCPKWCTETHQARHSGSDRAHWSDTDATVKLTLGQAVVLDTDEGYTAYPPSLSVFLQQEYRETEPRVVVEPDFTDTGSRYDLTPAEAMQLGHALIEAAELAGGVA
ncbi:DUF6907 domain-containing protein [Amycolatopsis pithecellobii]|uniref:Uncharacterized protein n=1 Tax=Amycolatopsis pithecellobii TaxID=664692 RepID=A0A6N7YUY4_9PSEU|nr:hypothetical protein [Amycolatopsis pithecellobii]MTD55728.1 hypothetical protein [Amycolatopsis pithecellobii]